MKSRKVRNRYNLKLKNKNNLPIVYVSRSNKYLRAQCISEGKIIASASDLKVDNSDKKTKMERASAVGEELGEKMKSSNITKCVFDFGGRKFFGRIKKFVESLREKMK